MQRQWTWLAVIAILALGATGAAAASTTSWTGAVDDSWSNDDNWTGGEPTTGSSALVNTGRAVITETGEYIHYNLYVGQYAGHDGTIVMNSGDLTGGYNQYVGNSGAGTFEQYGGIYWPQMGLTIGRNNGGVGTYRLEGGELQAGVVVVGENGTGLFEHVGGLHECSSLRIADKWVGTTVSTAGTYNIYGGELNAGSITVAPDLGYPGTFDIRGHRADVVCRSDFTLGADAILLAVPHSRLHIHGSPAHGGDIIIRGSTSSNLSGLRNLELVFDPDTSTSDLEVCGYDYGNAQRGFCGNFHLAALTVGQDTTSGTLILRDNIDNGNRGGGSEALYVDRLTVRSGFTLSLNGLNLYCREAVIEPGATISGGTPVVTGTGDIHPDGVIDMLDVAVLCQNWLRQDCDCLTLCDGADIVADGAVDLNDFAALEAHWQGTALVFSETFDADAGWTTEGEWAFGTPAGGGGTLNGNPDPTGGYTGDFVYGINLAGDYALVVAGAQYLTSPSINCLGQTDLELRFWRHLNCDAPGYVVAWVQAFDGAAWQTIWTNDTNVMDATWVEMVLDVSAYADNNPNFRLRWGHAVVSSGAWAFSGWNIDDVTLTGALP